MAFLGALALVAGCSTGPAEVADGRTGFALQTDILGGTDVVGFNYTVTEVTCPAGVQVVSGLKGQLPLTFGLDLLDEFLPGNLPGVSLVNVGDSQLEYDSVHLAADLFVDVVPDACYSIVVQPVKTFGPDDATDTDDTPTAECAKAETPAPLYVAPGQTTEVFLLSQCVGEPVGAIDAAVALNNPPQIATVDIIDDKFVHECVSFETCVTAFDPNDDPLLAEFTLVQVELPDGTIAANGSPEVGNVATYLSTGILTGWDDGRRMWEFCDTRVPSVNGSYTWNVKVFDTLTDSSGTSGVKFETVLQGNGVVDEIEVSHSTLDYLSHTTWSREPLCYEDDGSGGTLTRLVDGTSGVASALTREAFDIAGNACTYTADSDYYCNVGTPSVSAAEAAFTCPGGTLDPTAVYPSCSTLP